MTNVVYVKSTGRGGRGRAFHKATCAYRKHMKSRATSRETAILRGLTPCQGCKP